MSIDKKSTYYDVGGIETVDFMRAKLTHEQLEGHYLACIIKYSSRCNYKGTKKRDIEKLAIYSRLLNEIAQDDEVSKDNHSVPLSNMEAIRNDVKNGDR